MRILAGLYKGRKLLAPPKDSITRPITGAAKKSLMDTLAPLLEGATVLDLYCGTGTMGLEALSRGAKLCCFAEKDPKVVGRLKRNIAEVGAEDRSFVWRGDLTNRLSNWVQRLDEPVKIAFVDPPFAHARRWNWKQIERKLFDPLAEALAADGRVALRVPAKVDVPEQLGRLVVKRTKNYGGMEIALLGLPE
ncbi:MAG: RsmD family RNA methyltransferase [Phycisphaerae bacterium]